jgi:transposase InsO family protein
VGGVLDEGSYLCSESTMYRILREAGGARERRRQATHPARTRPELVTTGPGQVWSWDITKLHGPAPGVYYDLYVIIDTASGLALSLAWPPPPRRQYACGQHRWSPSRLLAVDRESLDPASELVDRPLPGGRLAGEAAVGVGQKI